MKRSLALCSAVTGGMIATAVGCGDVYAEPDGAGGSSSVGGIVIEGGPNSPAAAELPVFCPAARPRENGPCADVGSSCEYGKSSDPECNTVLVCRGAPEKGAWEPRASDPCHESACPKSAEVAGLDGRPCELPSDGGVISDVDEAVCNVADGVCACTTGRGGASAHARMWVCVRPISVCPVSRPLAGQPCIGGLWCDYGSCAFKRGLSMECKDGTWLPGSARCQ